MVVDNIEWTAKVVGKRRIIKWMKTLNVITATAAVCQKVLDKKNESLKHIDSVNHWQINNNHACLPLQQVSVHTIWLHVLCSSIKICILLYYIIIIISLFLCWLCQRVDGTQRVVDINLDSSYLYCKHMHFQVFGECIIFF